MTGGAVSITIQTLEHGDLPAALAIQSAVYPAFLVEDETAFASRLALPDSLCLAAVKGDTLVAYLLAHGWPRAAPPAAGTVLSACGTSKVLYIHDLAVSPAGQGSAIGRRLIDRAFTLAASMGLNSAELIAVEGAAGFWRGLGFAEATGDERLEAKIKSYGPDARWMRRAIP